MKRIKILFVLFGLLLSSNLFGQLLTQTSTTSWYIYPQSLGTPPSGWNTDKALPASWIAAGIDPCTWAPSVSGTSQRLLGSTFTQASIDTAYFRTTFVLSNMSNITDLQLRYNVDDNAIFTLNGTVIASGGAGGNEVFDVTVPISSLRCDTNVLAVRVINTDSGCFFVQADLTATLRGGDSASSIHRFRLECNASCDTVILKKFTNFYTDSSILWNDGTRDSIKILCNAGNYIATTHLNGCIDRDTFIVEIAPCCDTCNWKVTGNNITSSSRNIFGTLTNDNVRIFTNNQQRGILTNTGNFGWNTPSPSAKFHVNVTASTLTTGIRFEGLMPSQDPNILSVDPMGNVHMMPVPASGISSACSTQNFVPKVATVGSPNLICSQIFDNGVNVGINTTSPNAQLHQVTAAATASIHKFSNATIGNLVTDGFDVGIGSTGIGEIRQKENLGMNFYTNNAQRATIDANGYIGFNQPTPLANLDIMNIQCDNRPAIKITNDYVNATCNVGVSHGNYIECISSISPTTQFIVTDGGSVGIRCVPSTFTSGTGGWTATTTPSQQVRLDVNGLTRSTFFATTSDAKYKTNISPLNNSLSNIMKLKGVEYNWKSTQYPSKQFDELKHSGFIAQELMEVLPNSVIKDKDGDYAVDYNSVIPVLTEAIKEQQKQIENQQAQIEELKKLVAQNGSKNSGATGIGEANKSIDGYLAQNTPNPFSNSTEIKYQLPKAAQTAMLGIYDLNGKQIRMFPINTEQNSGSITVQANDLQAGMYLYSLVVDGKAFDTKRMVLTAQ